MFKRFTLLLPTAGKNWSVWSCPPAASIVREADVAAGETLPKSRGRTVVGLPVRGCRTFAVKVPSQESRVLRPLAHAQLEKRGLSAGSLEKSHFDCWLIPLPGGGGILSVDSVAAGVLAEFHAWNAAGHLASGRCYELPEGKLVLSVEDGAPVAWAGRDGTLVHSQPLPLPGDRMDQWAGELRLICLVLEQQELVAPIRGVECLGEIPGLDLIALAAALEMPVEVWNDPLPSPGRAADFHRPGLIQDTGRGASGPGQAARVKWLAAAAALALVAWWGTEKWRTLTGLERQATQLEEALLASSGANQQEKQVRDRVRATQERWQGLKMALEPKRYPVVQLNSFTKCLGGGQVVLTRFESKGPELSVSGAAQSAMEAYQYYTAVNSEPDLRLFEWSMIQPTIAPNGAASFQIKGKMR
ncbi:MAG: hypothetical protein JWL81_2758 [Verrucomicrobiales bacterium]|nr:hypothetical protein [Verrucomicrobiales bacterium]